MFGLTKKVERVRTALVHALKLKSIAIMNAHAQKKPEEIPKHDLARSMVLHDLAEILQNLHVKHPENERDDGEEPAG